LPWPWRWCRRPPADHHSWPSASSDW
jgi:hypothetical protein